MKHILAPVCIAAACILASVSVAFGQGSPEFKLGFKALADQVQDVVGQAIEDEHWGANGDSLQRTTKGMLAWRKADNWTAFTNGHMTWINGPAGVQSRLNTERFDWERDQQTTAPAAVAPAPDQGTTGAAAPGKDWTTVDRSSDGFKIALPPTWRHVDLDNQDLVGEFKDIVKDYPNADSLAQSYAAAALLTKLTGGVFFAVPITPEFVRSPGSTLVKILKIELDRPMTMDEVVSLASASFEKLLSEGAISNIAHRRVTLPAGEAEEFAYVQKVKLGALPEVRAGVVEYLLIHDGYMYDLVFLAMNPGGARELKEITEAMANSFQFAGAPSR